MNIEIVDRKSFYKGAQGCRDKHYCDGLGSSAHLFLPSLYFIILRQSFLFWYRLVSTRQPRMGKFPVSASQVLRLYSCTVIAPSPIPTDWGALGRVMFIIVKDYYAETDLHTINERILFQISPLQIFFAVFSSLVSLSLSYSKQTLLMFLWDFSSCWYFVKDLSLVYIGS